MSLWITLIAVLPACAWIALTDMPAAFAPAGSAGISARRGMRWAVAAFIAVGGIVWGVVGGSAIGGSMLLVNYGSVVMVVSAAMVAAMATVRLSRHNSFIYALLGASAGWLSFYSGNFDQPRLLMMPVIWVIAPLMAGILAAGISLLCRKVISRPGLHLVTMSYRMRFAIAVALGLLALVVGINNGALLIGLLGVVSPDFNLRLDTLHINGSQVLWLGIVVLVTGFLGHTIMRRTTGAAQGDMYADAPSSFAAILASALVMLFFSTPASSWLTGAICTPLSAGQLVLAAIAGTQLVRRKPIPALSAQLWRSLISVLVTPALAFVVAYAGASVFMDGTGASVAVTLGSSSAQQYNMTVPLTITVVILMLAAMAILSYKYIKLKSGLRSQGVEQQRRLFEKQNDITTLEIRQILSENESLNHRLEQQREELINIALNIGEQKEFLSKLYGHIAEVRSTADADRRDKLFAQIETVISSRMSFSQESESFYARAEALHRDFGLRLSEKFPHLTARERKMVTLLRLGFSSKYIAALMNISPKSADISRHRLRSKLGIEREQKLQEFIKAI